jgi:hypothetical protein
MSTPVATNDFKSVLRSQIPIRMGIKILDEFLATLLLETFQIPTDGVFQFL